MVQTIKAVIFDLDGTLLDTRADLLRSINHLRAQHTLSPLTAERAVEAIGRGVEHLVARVLETSEGASLEDEIARFRDHYLAHCTEATEPYPGIPELLDELHTLDVKVAVVTNKPQPSAARLVDELNLAIDKVIGAGDETPKKPDPAMLLEAISVLGVDRRTSIYVGDMDVDLQTARAADCPFIGVDFGFVPNSELPNLTAVCVDTVDALRRALIERD